MTASISLLVVGLFRFSLPGSVLVIYMSLGMHPFLPDCQICWCIVAHKFSYNCFYFFGVGCDFSSFIHDFIYLGPFSFLLDKSGQGVYLSY